MRILSADTSSRKFSIALLERGVPIDQYEPISFNRHSSDLLPAIDKLLSRNSYSIEDVDAFCIGLGPGSFTGLRVGITTMRALALSLKKPIVGIPSIDAIAHNLSGYKGYASVIIDARQEKVYARRYSFSAKRIEPKGRIALLGIDELLKNIKGPTIFLGDGLEIYKDRIIEEKKELAAFAQESTYYPKAAIIGRLAIERLKTGKRDNAFKLSPLYIYPKECQIKKHKR
ncbi:MAG: tRNA (adenosine(37)-N6)-threonylcarbamoyltransferase complex dimerization subunit type 1 TsaB [Candidatus Omnitrophica bacterium]|nr:tRNA (adenosine(37)-N6)-threonylcarbamoyltransferase complex dimerization subunit type 1 TsaB [Candidatus Omnitrophota bacterium]